MRIHRIVTIFGVCAAAIGLSAQSSTAKCPPYPDGTLGDPTPLFRAIDLNHDGQATHEEWQKVEAPEPSWNAFQGKALVKKHGYVTLFDFLTDSPPGGIDTGCKGYFSLDDFLATKKMAPGGGAGGPGGAAGGPGGAATPGGQAGGAPPQGGSGGPGGPGGPGGGAGSSSSPTPPSPTAPREALAAGTYPTDAPGKCSPYPDGGISDPSPAFYAIDTKRTDKITHAQWTAAGAPEAIWAQYMEIPRVQKNGYLTLYDMVMHTLPNGADTNCDGSISLDELKAINKWKAGPGKLISSVKPASASAQSPASPGGAPAGGQGAPPSGAAPSGAPAGAAPGGGQAGAQVRSAPAGMVYYKSDKLIAEVDTNKDGCLSKAEWVAAGLPDGTYSILEGQAAVRDCVTDKELTKGPAPAGLDTNGDGYITVAKLRAQLAKNGSEPGGGGAAGGQGGPGGGPGGAPGGEPGLSQGK